MMWLFIAIVFVVIAVVDEICIRRRLRPIAMRSCRGREWRRRFPDSPSAAIREFLLLFAGEFGLARLALKLRPDDRVMDVYRAIYPPKVSFGDQCELESFALSVERRYGMELIAMWRDDLTLGEIFGRAWSGGSQVEAGGV